MTTITEIPVAPAPRRRSQTLVKWLAPASLAAGLVILVAYPAAAGERERTETVTRTDDRIEGEWSLDPKRDDGRVSVSLRREWRSGADRSTWSSTFDARPADLEGITPSQWSARDVPVVFKLRRDAGTFDGTGRLRNGRGSGRFAFVPDPAFRRELQALGIEAGSAEDLARLCLNDVSLDWIRAFDARIVRGLTLDDLVRLHVHGLSAQFVQGMRRAGLEPGSVDDLVRLKIHGVDPDYVRDMNAVERSRYTVEDLVRLRIHGVLAATPRELDRLGYPPPSADDLVRLQTHGVSLSFIRELDGVGYSRLTAEDLIRLHQNGVTASIIRRAKIRHPNLGVEELIRLKQRGEF